jgi:hypothetical protein
MQLRHLPAHGRAVGVLFAARSDDEGPTDIYMRGYRRLEIHRCKNCGGVMFWTPVDKTYERMGVNERMLPPGSLESVLGEKAFRPALSLTLRCGECPLWVAGSIDRLNVYF